MPVDDPVITRNRQLLLEADVLLNYYGILRRIDAYITGCEIDMIMLNIVAQADKTIYKKGEDLKVFAAVVYNYKAFEGKAIIDGKEVSSENGQFNYTRKISEKPGRYKVPITIMWINAEGKTDTFQQEPGFEVR